MAAAPSTTSSSSTASVSLADVGVSLGGNDAGAAISNAEPEPPSTMWDIVRQAWIMGSSPSNYRTAERRLFENTVHQTPYELTSVEIPGKSTIRTLDVPGSGNGNGHCSSNSSPVVLAHGYGSGLGVWAPSLDTFHDALAGDGSGRKRRVVAFDWLGCGGSSRPPFNASGREAAEDFYCDGLERWREAMGVEKMVLVGHSLGGYMSSVYALRHPARVEKLILVSPVGIPSQPSEEDMSARLDQLPTRFKMAIKTARWLWDSGVTPHGVVRAFGPLGGKFVRGYIDRRHSHQSDEMKAVLTEYHYQILAGRGSGEHALSEVLSPGAYAKSPLCDRLPRLDPAINVAFVYGEHDWMDADAGASVSASIPGQTSLMRVEGGHMMMLDAPEKFGAALARCVNDS